MDFKLMQLFMEVVRWNGGTAFLSGNHLQSRKVEHKFTTEHGTFIFPFLFPIEAWERLSRSPSDYIYTKLQSLRIYMECRRKTTEVEGPRVVNFFSRRRSNDGIWGISID